MKIIKQGKAEDELARIKNVIKRFEYSRGRIYVYDVLLQMPELR